MPRAFFIVLLVLFSLRANVALSADRSNTTALKAALTKRAQHAARWLEERDFKSLAQSTGSLVLLGEVLRSQGDESTWQMATGNVLANARDLQAAAQSEDAARCQSVLAGLETSIARLEKLETAGKSLEPPKPPLRPLMLTLDSIQADAKVALLTGNSATAKNQAAVLAELAPLVSNSRTGDAWSALATDFQKACQLAATTPEADAKAIRQLFRGIAQRCETCHENNRTR